ncbi:MULTISPECIES: ABC transporter permease [unclassified Oceanispirochaeta]|uniref:ABC transporter permease n=1 Tax=unclassified Oceanispirochaeta TaxID=2635722 RepID=UPI000E08CF7B|nr:MULTISPECIES: ABC transporter permease [unclassified Oceanispirochaeta]MBF9016676.1 ABC transporter permease [Oceanispirochaeta sp. M2]NPD73119.1 ABC transporter permease [Oceanispirochaeta sp. M1]RDG31220.1 ABC transporter permease [Oceanispirochaeta sp. M1]
MNTLNTALGQTQVKMPAYKKIPVQNLIIFSVLVLLIIIFSILSPRFLSSKNLVNIVRQTSYVIITGSAVTFLMISGNFDLSVGSAAALSGVFMAILARSGVPVPLAILGAVGLGIFIGYFNSLMVCFFEIPPFIATLGTMLICRGTALIISGGVTIRNDLPENYNVLGRGEFLNVPFPIWIMLAVVIVAVILQNKSLLGKYAIAIGGNKLAAQLSGINVNKMVSLFYIIIGGIVGLTGAIQSSRLGIGEPNIGDGFEFDVIIAIILGGTSLDGGEGSVMGMVVGALLIGVIGNGLNMMGVLTFYQSIIKGVVLVAAVLLDQRIKSKRN